MIIWDCGLYVHVDGLGELGLCIACARGRTWLVGFVRCMREWMHLVSLVCALNAHMDALGELGLCVACSYRLVGWGGAWSIILKTFLFQVELQPQTGDSGSKMSREDFIELIAKSVFIP